MPTESFQLSGKLQEELTATQQAIEARCSSDTHFHGFSDLLKVLTKIPQAQAWKKSLSHAFDSDDAVYFHVVLEQATKCVSDFGEKRIDLAEPSDRDNVAGRLTMFAQFELRLRCLQLCIDAATEYLKDSRTDSHHTDLQRFRENFEGYQRQFAVAKSKFYHVRLKAISGRLHGALPAGKNFALGCEDGEQSVRSTGSYDAEFSEVKGEMGLLCNAVALPIILDLAAWNDCERLLLETSPTRHVMETTAGSLECAEFLLKKTQLVSIENIQQALEIARKAKQAIDSVDQFFLEKKSRTGMARALTTISHVVLSGEHNFHHLQLENYRADYLHLLASIHYACAQLGTSVDAVSAKMLSTATVLDIDDFTAPVRPPATCTFEDVGYGLALPGGVATLVLLAITKTVAATSAVAMAATIMWPVTLGIFAIGLAFLALHHCTTSDSEGGGFSFSFLSSLNASARIRGTMTSPKPA